MVLYETTSILGYKIRVGYTRSLVHLLSDRLMLLMLPISWLTRSR
jgi:hypothetical protein